MTVEVNAATVAIIISIISALGSLVAIWVNLNNKIAYNSKDIESNKENIFLVRKAFDEHKVGNEKSFDEIKITMRDDRELNRLGRGEIIASVNKVRESLNDFSVEMSSQFKNKT
jgi:hypothetical protein